MRAALAPGGPGERAGIDPGTVVVAVASGKGGVGKTTVSLNLALALAERGLAVGVLDADFYGPDIPLMVNLKRTARRERWLLGRAAAFGGGSILEPVEELGLKLMSIGFLIGEDQSLAMAAPLLRSTLLQLLTNVRWGPLDYLLIDMPPGTADLQQELLGLVAISGAVIVVTPQDVAHLDGRRVLDMLTAAGVEVIGGVENMAGLLCPHCNEPVEVFPRVSDDRSIWHTGVPRLASLPLDPAVAHTAEHGKPIFAAHPDTEHANAYRHLAATVAEFQPQPSTRPTGTASRSTNVAPDSNPDVT
jgi:ATP-binding protein involved in chromosome partitioning